MCNYLWYFHRDSYSWRIQVVPNTWSGPAPIGQVSGPPNASGITEEMLVPRPRIAVHLNYHLGGKHRLWLLIHQGYCLAESTRASNISLCADMDANAVFRDMFMFQREVTDISKSPAAIEAYHSRQALLSSNNLCNHTWNEDILDELIKVSSLVVALRFLSVKMIMTVVGGAGLSRGENTQRNGQPGAHDLRE